MEKYEALFYALIAAVFGLIRYGLNVISGKRDFDPKKIKYWIETVFEIMACASIGILMYWVTSHFEIEARFSYAITAVSGHIGVDIYVFARKVIEQKLGIKSDE